MSPYINESLIEASTYTISESDKFVFGVTNPIPGTNAVMSINAGGYTSIMAVDGVFAPLESTTFDKNVDIPITLNIVNSSNNLIITSLSLNIHWVQVTLQAKMATYLENVSSININDQIIDSQDNIYLTGGYTSNSTSQPFITLKNISGNTQTDSNVTLPVPNTNSAHAFIIKYNSSGIVQWATYFSANTLASSKTICLDNEDNVYIAGQYDSNNLVSVLKNASGNSQINSSISLPAAVPGSGFLIKYNPSGVVQWATGITNSDFVDMVIKDSYIHLTGKYANTGFYPLQIKDASGNTQVNSSLQLPVAFNFSILTITYNLSGVSQWVNYFRGNVFSGNATANGITTDSYGNIYITGFYNSTSSINLKDVSGTIQVDSAITLPATNGNAGFIVKYNSSGITQWATVIDGVTIDQDQCNEIAIDSQNNIYITGTYTTLGDVLTIKNASGNSQTNSNITLPATTTTSVFVTKYNSSGIALWATSFMGSTSTVAVGLCLDENDDLYASGYYNSPSVVTLKDASGNNQVDSTMTLPSTSYITGYIVKYNSDGIVKLSTVIKSLSDLVIRKCFTKNGDVITCFDTTSSISSSVSNTIYDSLGNSQIVSQVTLPNGSGNRFGGFVKYHMYDYTTPSPMVIKASQNEGSFTTVAENSTLTTNLNESLRLQTFFSQSIPDVANKMYSIHFSRYSNFPGAHTFNVLDYGLLTDTIFTVNKNNFVPVLSSGERVYFKAFITDVDLATGQLIVYSQILFSVIMN